MKGAFFIATLLNLSLVANAVTCTTGVIVPLYIYPGTSCSGWSTLTTAMSGASNVPFYIIVNPASGPGATNSTPDANYQACIPQLRSASSNVKVVGYVATGFGLRSTSLVTADINTYAGWGTGYRPDGIFLDETSTTSGTLATYQGYASTIRSKTWHSASQVYLNPGTAAPSGLYTIADLVLSVETYYLEYSSSLLVLGNSGEPVSKQAVVLHTELASVDTTSGSPLNSFVTDQLKAVYLTAQCLGADTGFNPYGAFGSDFSGLVSAVKSAGGC